MEAEPQRHGTHIVLTASDGTSSSVIVQSTGKTLEAFVGVDHQAQAEARAEQLNGG